MTLDIKEALKCVKMGATVLVDGWKIKPSGNYYDFISKEGSYYSPCRIINYLESEFTLEDPVFLLNKAKAEGWVFHNPYCRDVGLGFIQDTLYYYNRNNHGWYKSEKPIERYQNIWLERAEEGTYPPLPEPQRIYKLMELEEGFIYKNLYERSNGAFQIINGNLMTGLNQSTLTIKYISEYEQKAGFIKVEEDADKKELLMGKFINEEITEALEGK